MEMNNPWEPLDFKNINGFKLQQKHIYKQHYCTYINITMSDNFQDTNYSKVISVDFYNTSANYNWGNKGGVIRQNWGYTLEEAQAT